MKILKTWKRLPVRVQLKDNEALIRKVIEGKYLWVKYELPEIKG